MNMQGYLQRHGKDGSPDLIAFVPVDRTMWIMFPSHDKMVKVYNQNHRNNLKINLYALIIVGI